MFCPSAACCPLSGNRIDTAVVGAAGDWAGCPNVGRPSRVKRASGAGFELSLNRENRSKPPLHPISATDSIVATKTRGRRIDRCRRVAGRIGRRSIGRGLFLFRPRGDPDFCQQVMPFLRQSPRSLVAFGSAMAFQPLVWARRGLRLKGTANDGVSPCLAFALGVLSNDDLPSKLWWVMFPWVATHPSRCKA